MNLRDLFKKIKIPAFFKTKKFLLLVIFCLIFFLFTPISLIQINKTLENFIDERAKAGVESFQKQTGLLIDWDKLDFKLLSLTVHLEKVKISSLPGIQKIEELNFLDGSQEIKKVSARPSLLSLLFDKKIFLSKLYIEEGNISLKTLKSYSRSYKNPRDSFQLPIKKIRITKTQVKVTHKNHILRLSEIETSLLQREKRRFDFDIFIERFFIDSVSNQRHIFQRSFPDIKKESVYEISTKGVFQPGQLSVNYLFLKNDRFQSHTKALSLDFEDQEIQNFKADSTGSLPFVFIESVWKLFRQDLLPYFESQLDYDFNLSYEKRKGWKGDFKVSSKNSLLLSYTFKKIDVKGRIQNFLVLVDEGVLEIEKEGSLSIKKAELFIDKPYFNLTLQTKEMSSDFVMKNILNQEDFLVRGDFTGQVNCNGNYTNSIECEFQGSSSRVQLRPNKQEIFSIYDFNLDFNIAWIEKEVKFELSAEKEKSQLLLKGGYQTQTNELNSSYSFIGDIGKDVKFRLPFDLRGTTRVRQGLVSFKDNQVEVSGFIISPLLKVDSYRLENIASVYRFSNNKLLFPEIKSNPGQTQYSAKLSVDFSKEELNLELNSNLFQVNDFFYAVKDRFQAPFDLEGTGTIQASFRQSWNNPEDKEFDFKGNIFNIKIDQDFFKQSHFHFSFKDNQGELKELSLKKIEAELKGSGVFDKDYSLNVNFELDKFRLENFNFLNSLFPFNQTGDIKGKLKMTGSLKNPEVIGELFISNTFLYSYPVKDTQLKLKMNKAGLSMAGTLVEEIRLSELSYPFEKNQNMKLKGYFKNLDLIAFLFSKFKKNKTEDYRSQIEGSFDLEREANWKGAIQINQLSLFKLNQSFKMQAPLYLFLEKDRWSMTPTWFSDDRNRFFSIEDRENNQLLLSGTANLGFFSVFFPFMENISADITGQVLINNNLKNVQARGSFEMNSGLIQLPSLPEFKNIKSNLVFSKEHLYINDLSASAGGGTIKGLGSIKKPFQPDPELDLNFSFKKVHFQIPEGFNTKGSGQIKIQGSTPYLIRGNYDLDSGSIVREFSSSGEQDYDFDLLKEEDTESQSLLQLDLKLKTKNPIQLNSSLIRSSLEGETLLSGPLSSLIMNGEFKLSKGLKQNLIFFRGQEFRISSGLISFLNSKPKNPYINISANSVFKERVIDPLQGDEEIEREYVIFLSSKGFADDLKFSLRSSPSLKETEIISLLTLGVSSRHFDSNVRQDVTDYSYQILASLLVEKPLNREIKEALGLDFRLTPYINILNKPVTKVTLSRTWFEKWKTSFSRTIEESAQSDIRLKYDISPKISLTGFWENNELLYLDQIEQDWLGLDFEFKFDF